MQTRINIPFAIIGGLIFMVIAQIIHSLGAFIGMGYYTDPAYFHLWSKIMMPAEGSPPPAFFIMSLFFNFITGFLFYVIYSFVKPAITGESLLGKSIVYTLIVFLLASLPGFLSILLILNLPIGLNLLWMLEGLIIYFINSIIAVKLIK